MPAPAACPRCAAPFECGRDTIDCWCNEVSLNDITRTSLAEFYAGCLCRTCLTEMENRPPAPSVRDFLKAQLKRKYGRR